MVDKCTVSFTVRDTLFALRPGQTVAFRPTEYAVDAVGSVLRVRQTVQVTANGSGAATVDLVPGPYNLETQTDDGLASVPCLVPDQASATLDGILVNLTPAALETLAAIVTAARDQVVSLATTIGTLAELETIAADVNADATAAQGARTAAEAAAAIYSLGSQDDARSGLSNWQSGFDGAPNTQNNVTGLSLVTGDADFATCVQRTVTTGGFIATRQVYRAKGRAIRVRARIKVVSLSSGTSAGFRIVAWPLNASFVRQTTVQNAITTTCAVGQIIELEETFGGRSGPGITVAHSAMDAWPYARFGVNCLTTGVTVEYRLESLFVEDIAAPLDVTLDWQRRPNVQQIAVLGDTQPITVADYNRVTALLDMIAATYPEAAMLAHVGDLVDAGDSTRLPAYGAVPYTVKDMYEALRRSGVPERDWLVIPGNHDIDYNADATNDQWSMHYRTFLTWFSRQFFYVRRGNHVMIFMGAMARNTAGNISDDVVEWCKEIVRRHQGCLIGIYTHHPVQNTVAGSTSVGGSLLESSRFTDWVGTAGYKVQYWISGHSGTDLNNAAVTSHTTIGGVCYIGVDMNVGADSEVGTGGGFDPSWVGIELTRGSPTVTFKRWNTITGAVSKTWTVTAPGPMELSHDYQFDGRYQYDDRAGIMSSPQLIRTSLGRLWNGTAYVPVTTPQTVLTLAVEDLHNDDAQAGQGASLVCRVPGANTGSSANNQPNLNRASRFGARFGAVRTTGGETDFSAAARISASTASTDAYPGFGEANEVPVIDFGASAADLKVSGYSIKFSHANAGEAGLSLAQSTGGVSAVFFARGAGSTGYSGTNTVMAIGYAPTNRSINAGGTINASGADYAEYREVAPHLYGKVAKGAFLGMRADGLLTDRWADVTGRVFVKSTAPNLVGNDTWGREDAICARYGIEPVGEPPVRALAVAPPLTFAADTPLDVADGATRAAQEQLAAEQASLDAAYDAARAAWVARRTAFEAALEIERQRHDRIALCGRVPANLAATEADIGKYLVPCADDDGGITARLIARADLTLADYIDACAVIETIAPDGRPIVNVKIA